MAKLNDILTDEQIKQLDRFVGLDGIPEIIDQLSISEAIEYIISLDEGYGYSVCLDNRVSIVEWPEKFQYWKWE